MNIVGFEHLHLHGHGSLLDGYASEEEIGNKLVKNNQSYFVLTDHGMMCGIPKQIKVCDELNLNPIFGCELYINPLQPNEKKETDQYTKDMNPEEKEIFRKSYHLVALACSEQGYKNLVRLCSWGWLNGFYRKPRINYDQLQQYKEGIVFSSACFNSEIGQTLNNRGEDAAFDMVETYHNMLGDKFYLEMMLLDFGKQKTYNQFLIKAHEKFGIPLNITCDSHYANPEDAYMQRLFLMVQTGKTISQVEQLKKENEDLFELQDQNLWCKSEEELNQKWESAYQDTVPLEIYEEAKRNTVRIAEMCKGVKIDRSPKLPQIPNANEKLLDAIKEGLKKRNYPKNKQTETRIREEYELIVKKEFASYFLIQKMMVDEARRVCPILLGWGDGSEAVGPGRGSGAGSLILYLLGVTDVDPIKHDLLFSRFLFPARGGKQLKLKFAGKPL